MGRGERRESLGQRDVGNKSEYSRSSKSKVEDRNSELSWSYVVYISENIFKEAKKEALMYKKLLEREVVKALEDNNLGILRYTVNRLHRIRRSVSSKNLRGVVNGDTRALEGALKELLLCSWDGPIVKYLDKDKQERVDKGEIAPVRFLKKQS